MTVARPSTALVGALTVLTLALGGCASSQGGPPPSSAAPAPTSAAAPSAARDVPPASVPVTTTAADAAAPARPLAGVFPSVVGATCRPTSAQDQLTTTTGADPTEAYLCDYASVAPGAIVIFARWADTTAARSFYDDTVRLGPRIEEFTAWQTGGVDQGPLYTAQSGSTVISTALYEGLPYSWEIRTATLDQSNQVFGQLQFVPRSQIPS